MTRNSKESPSNAPDASATAVDAAVAEAVAKASVEGSTIKTTPVAIIGVGSIFPQARATQDYWDNILRKIDSVTDVPASRWSIADYYDPNPAAPDKSYCKRGAFIPDIDFDPMEFGLPPNILEVTDVSQLISLVVAKEALEDSGYGEEKQFDRDHTGCILGFVGTSSKLFTPLMARLQYPVWKKVLLNVGIPEADAQKIVEKIKSAYVGWEENSFPGSIGNIVAGRIANRFDLGGVNCVIDAACGSSLAAVKMAVGELISGRANMMITGGVDTDNSINSYMCFSKTPAFSKGENVRTFDAESGGMMVGEGLGMLVLKRLADAERDGDRIYAVIKGVGASSDGRFKSIYAPRPDGQAKALRRAYEEAGYAPATVGLLEAHGTATPAGDPAEFQSMLQVFGENNPRAQYIALGSVKSQIAHTKAAAGAASMIKTALALYHKVLPPTINVTKVNPKFSIEKTPFYINTETRPWIRARSSVPRRAGVSSFGFGGTNYHIALEEYQPEHSGAYRLNTVARPVLLAAPDPAQLLAACRDAQQKLQGAANGVGEAVVNFNNLVQASRELEVPASFARVGFVAETPEEARQALQVCIDTLAAKPQEESWENPKGIYYRKSGLEVKGKIVALFSGQGSQYLEMGREIAVNFPAVREVFGAVDELFLQDGLEPLSSRVYPRPVFDQKERDALTEALTRTEHAQPAIGSISVSLYKLLQQAGFQPDFVAGHSFGELTALWAAGVYSEADYYTLAKARGKAMSPPDDPTYDAGTMVAVKGNVEKVREALKGDDANGVGAVTLANLNSNDQVVIAGSKPALERAQKLLTEQGFKTIPLTVSAAFHTPLVGHAQKPFAKTIQSVKFNKPQVRVYSNSTAQPHDDNPETIQEMLAGHILKPVLFRDEINNIYQAGGAIFVEFGPKNVLTNLVDNILAGKPHLAVALNANAKKDSDRQLRDAVMALRVAGLPLKNFDPYEAERKVAAPRKKSPVTVKLNGGYYTSEKTKKAFENALNDGFKVSLASAAAPAPVAPVAAPASPVVEKPAAPAPAPVVETAPANGSGAAAANFEYLISEYQAQQSETLRLHEQYLRMEEEYARAFAQLTQLQTELVSKGSSVGTEFSAPGQLQAVIPLFESLERSMTRFHDHQAETLRVHQHYLETQDRLTQSFMQGVTGAPAAFAPAAPARVAPAPRPEPVSRPPEPVTRSVVVPPVPASTNGAEHKAVAAPVAAAPAPVTETKPAPAPAPAAAGLSVEKLKSALLAIVSEKTGYPVETLELDMDMEADLGIDSIKRVEILGAMQTQFPELPKIETNVLAELRTLGQIVNQFSEGSSAASASASAAPVASVPAAPAPAVAAPAPAVAAPSMAASPAVLTQALLQIVSEKTGYPVETLELGMDMEADLGIDSIKRVEILGAMQTQFPDLPKIETNALAELRTLGQIVEAMSATLPLAGSLPMAGNGAVASQPAAQATPVEAAPAAQTAPAAGVSAEKVAAALLAVVSEKTGYPVETLELGMDMEADLGIDSIKRVEILGAMQTQFPELPKPDAAALAELRTLGQITEYLCSTSPAAAPSQEVTGTSPFDSAPQGASALQEAAASKEATASQEAAASQEAVVASDVTTESAEPEAEPFDSGIAQGVVIRKILPAPDALDTPLPEGHVCLVTDDGCPDTPALAQALLQKGWPVVLLRFPTRLIPERHALPEGVSSVDLADLSEAALQTCLAEVTARFGPVAVFIHLTQMEQDGQPGMSFPEAEKSLMKMVFLTAKHLKPALNQAAEKGRAAFMTVTHLDGEFGLGEASDFTPIKGGLFGLVKTLNLEWDAVFCRAVDLSPALDTGRVVNCILAELDDPNRLITEVGYTQTERSTLVVAQVPVAVNGREK